MILAINYARRVELKEEIKEILIRIYLDSKEIKDSDLLIRTDSELRFSNFTLLQLAYTEIYVADMYWPDFTKNEFCSATLDCQKRKGGK